MRKDSTSLKRRGIILGRLLPFSRSLAAVNLKTFRLIFLRRICVKKFSGMLQIKSSRINSKKTLIRRQFFSIMDKCLSLETGILKAPGFSQTVKAVMWKFGYVQLNGGLDEYFSETKRFVDARRYRKNTQIHDTDY